MKDFTKIVIILDRSGSMQSCREKTIEGFNTFLREQQEIPGEASLTLVQFDDQYEKVYDLDLKDVKPLTQDAFVPRGLTALLDAQARTIKELGEQLSSLPESERPDKVVVVTLTDGLENSSTDYTRQHLAQMISLQEKTYNWNFIYLAAGQDAIKVGATMGYQHSNAANVADPARAMYLGSTYVKRVRGGTRGFSGQSVAITEEERNEAIK